MELKTQALDRLLEALSPALSAELERVGQETRESLEEEFNKRLQIAVSEAETAAQSNAAANAAADLNRAVAEATEQTREATRAEVTAEVSAKVTADLEEQFAQRLAENTSQVQSEAAAERARLQEQLEQWKAFADVQRLLAESSSQPEILAQFLSTAQPFAKALAVYVAKADGLALWKSRGEAAFPDIISQQTTDPESFFRTVTVRGRTVAAVCAAPPFKPEVMEFFSGCLERAIEVFGLKLRTPVPKVSMSEKTVAVSAPGGEPIPDEQKAHSDARRTAQLLVSEIKLYHEEELESGRQNNDIYQRLQRPIDIGREMYQHRVKSAVVGGHDYFHEELVRILGANDAARLGSAYPGPKNS
jgi:hypothetical protein